MESHNDKQPWYAEGLRFGCRQCGRCCGGEPGYVWVTFDDIRSIAAELGIPTDQFELAFVRSIPGYGRSLTERENGDCVLLDSSTRKCLVYKSRPVQCRTWPFWDYNIETASRWKKTAKRCPGCNNPEGKLYSLEEIEEQRDMF